MPIINSAEAGTRYKRLSPADSRITRAAVASHGPPHREAGGIGQSRSLGVSMLVYSRACVRLREGTRTHFLGTRSKSAGANSTARAGDERDRVHAVAAGGRSRDVPSPALAPQRRDPAALSCGASCSLPHLHAQQLSPLGPTLRRRRPSGLRPATTLPTTLKRG